MSVRLPIGSEARRPVKDRAWPEAALKTTVEQTLIRGLATAGPCSVSGLPRSRSGRRSVAGHIVGHEGSPPGAAPGHARSCPGMKAVVLLAEGWSWGMTGSGGGSRGLDPARDRPGEGRHLARDRGRDQVRVLAGGHEAAVAGAEPELRLPRDRPHRVGHAFQAALDLSRHPRREAVAPGTLDQHAPGPAVAGPGSGPGQALGDPAALDLGTARMLRGHQAQPRHELAGAG